VPFEVLVVDNNSTDDTALVVANEAERPGPPVRYRVETRQGIVPARNRAVEESLDSDYLVFLDDDERPLPGLLESALAALRDEGAVCVGGRVRVVLPGATRPAWLRKELLGFLAEVDYGSEPFWITGASTPVWTANVGYRVSLFREDPPLRFDHRYNRLGYAAGGGEDVVMFETLLARGALIRYRPDMVVDHHVAETRLRRRYFLRLHFESGRKEGRFSDECYAREVIGVPPFMLTQALGQTASATGLLPHRYEGWLRQAMNAAHAWGMVYGRVQRWRANGR
jgi:glycosyltransferase involved in cell wall biosynthesis